MSRRSLARAFAGLFAVSVLAGCGADDSGKASTKDDRDAAACDGTRLVVTELASGDSTTMDKAVAVSLAGGSAYTIYATDFDLPLDSLSAVLAPTVPADGSMATVSLTVFNAATTPDPIEAGTSITYTDDFGVLTFRVLQNNGTTVLGTNNDAKGTVSVDAVGDKVCIGVDYSDDEKTYSGTVEAAVKSL